MAQNDLAPLASAHHISRSIFLLRGHKTMLDTDLADLYGVTPRVLLQAVKRNRERFPDDFMIQLTAEEWNDLKPQIVTSRAGHEQQRKYPPYAFTAQGVAMLSSVLRSKRAIAVNTHISAHHSSRSIRQLFAGRLV